ncbi:hypothetical protein U1Q18_024749 [Sarracenia purpurea var. burkii]
MPCLALMVSCLTVKMVYIFYNCCHGTLEKCKSLGPTKSIGVSSCLCEYHAFKGFRQSVPQFAAKIAVKYDLSFPFLALLPRSAPQWLIDSSVQLKVVPLLLECGLSIWLLLECARIGYKEAAYCSWPFQVRPKSWSLI